MSLNTLKNTYKFVTLIALSTILGLLFHWNIKWYYFIFIIIASQYFGKLLYVIFSGINVSNIQFYDCDDIKSQEFSINLHLGFHKTYIIYGEFDNIVVLNESDISSIIYMQTTRKMLKPLLLFNQPIEINYIYNRRNIKIKFYGIL